MLWKVLQIMEAASASAEKNEEEEKEEVVGVEERERVCGGRL